MILFFSTVCSSFKGFKCVIQKLEDPENSWKFVRPKKNSGNFAKPRKIAKICQPRKIGFGQISNPKNRTNFKPKKIGRVSLSKF